jgi:transposase-like protein
MAGTFTQKVPSLAHLRRQYPTEDACRRLLEAMRWPQGPFCPHCGSFAHWELAGSSCRPGLRECRDCRRQYTVTTKTPLHATKLSLWTWIAAMYLVVTSSKGISSVVMSRLLGTTQSTAWRLGHAIREMTHDRNAPPLSGLVEIDLKYLGGAPKRRKGGQKSKRGKGTSKPRILIAVQRDDRMRATVVSSEKAEDIHAALDGVVAQPVKIFSDKDHTFVNVIKALGAGHQTVVHSAKEFVRGEVHSNTADGIGSLLERARMGVWHRMSRKHLQRYLDEISFRWNCRVKHEYEKAGKKRRLITTIPLPDMLSRLLQPSIGRQIRRTENCGFMVLDSPLARSA